MEDGVKGSDLNPAKETTTAFGMKSLMHAFSPIKGAEGQGQEGGKIKREDDNAEDLLVIAGKGRAGVGIGVGAGAGVEVGGGVRVREEPRSAILTDSSSYLLVSIR